MSTKPPTAVMIPSVSSSGFKRVLDLLELLRVSFQHARRRIVRPLEQESYLSGVSGVWIAERAGVCLKLPAKPAVHALDIGRGQPALVGLFVDQRPFRSGR